MQPKKHHLRNGRVLVIREAAAQDARAVLDYVEGVSGETDFLSFGPGEFELTEAEEEGVLRKYRNSDNQLYILGLIDDTVVSTLSFSAGLRPRVLRLQPRPRPAGPSPLQSASTARIARFCVAWHCGHH